MIEKPSLEIVNYFDLRDRLLDLLPLDSWEMSKYLGPYALVSNCCLDMLVWNYDNTFCMSCYKPINTYSQVENIEIH